MPPMIARLSVPTIPFTSASIPLIWTSSGAQVTSDCPSCGSRAGSYLGRLGFHHPSFIADDFCCTTSYPGKLHIDSPLCAWLDCHTGGFDDSNLTALRRSGYLMLRFKARSMKTVHSYFHQKTSTGRLEDRNFQ